MVCLNSRTEMPSKFHVRSFNEFGMFLSDERN